MDTLWLFNIALENPPIFKFGKPSISMDHLYHGYVSHNQRVNLHFPMDVLWISYGFPMV